jgi:hypothetical protein
MSTWDESKPEPLTSPDSDNASEFYGFDHLASFETERRLDGSETFEDHYARLSEYNRGFRTGRTRMDTATLRRQDNLALFDALSCQLELTPHQKRRGRLLFDTLPLSAWSSPGGIDAALVALMVAAVVAREDGRIYHPNRLDENNDAEFVRLIRELGYSKKAVRSAYAKVSEAL